MDFGQYIVHSRNAITNAIVHPILDHMKSYRKMKIRWNMVECLIPPKVNYFASVTYARYLQHDFFFFCSRDNLLLKLSKSLALLLHADDKQFLRVSANIDLRITSSKQNKRTLHFFSGWTKAFWFKTFCIYLSKYDNFCLFFFNI